jgi:predicted dehydrogenase
MSRSLGIGVLGYAFMGRAHAQAYRTLMALPAPPPLEPRLVAVAGRDADAVGEAARRHGFELAVTDWRELVADERVQLFDNCGPNGLHGEPTVAAAEAGKHVICEKPLGRDAGESFETWRRVAAAGVVHMCAFNYRFVPAVRLARELIAAGELGEVRHFRARYLQDWGLDATVATWRFEREQAGSGALGDLGAHVVDLGRHLVGEIASVGGVTRTFVGERGGRAVDVDDAFAAAVQFDGGAIGTLEASRLAPGRRNALAFEINGSKGSLAFDLERFNELRVYAGGSIPAPGAQGFRDVLVTDPGHPFAEHWWPPGHVLGWDATFVHELHHLLAAIRDGGGVRPLGADFEDGYRAAEVCDAIARSAAGGARESIRYRTLDQEHPA